MSGEILGLIPARGGSVGVPHKNIRQLGGRPLIHWTIDAALGSCLDRVLVSTDSEEVAAAARTAGADIPFLRPDYLAHSEAKAIGVIQHTLDFLRRHEGWEPSAVLYLQPTSPFRTSRNIDDAVSLLAGAAVDSVVSFAPASDHPSYIFWRDGQSLYPVLPQEPRIERRQDMRPAYSANCAIMGSKTPWLRAAGTYNGLIVNFESFVPYFIDADVGTDIDTERDFVAADLIARELTNRT